ncbi:MAG: hypothetical protein ACK4SO_01885 [Candidatus Kapaibacteriota bacterium]
MKGFQCVFFTIALIFVFPYNLLPQSSSMQKQQPTSPVHRDFIKVSTDTLFAFLDLINYFTNKKFNTYFNGMKKAWDARKFDEFDRLCENLGSNQKFLRFLRDRKNEGKDHFIVQLPSKPAISFVSQNGTRAISYKQIIGEKQHPENEDLIVTCDCTSPCTVCFCPGSCAVLSICLCFYDSSPGGIPSGGAGGYFCNMFRAGKPCALRPPDFSP